MKQFIEMKSIHGGNVGFDPETVSCIEPAMSGWTRLFFVGGGAVIIAEPYSVVFSELMRRIDGG